MSSARTLAELPEAVRTKVVALTADVLPSLAKLPPSLRRVATFAPARRARLGSAAIAGALIDDDLRGRVGAQLVDRVPADADVPERAALLWLTGSHCDELDALLEEVHDSDLQQEDTEAARLRERLDAAERGARESRARHRAQVEELKAENSALRRRLGESRSAHKAAQATAEQTAEALDELRGETEAQSAGHDREVRRLRARLADLEAELAAGRRAGRAERDQATVRARVLLETLVDAAAGLRRELGLPTTAAAPADRVESGLSTGGSSGGARVLTGASAGLLEQYLAMPRARLIVDGYNVSKTVWPSSSLEAQRIRLVNGLAALVARTGADTTVVFDAADVTTRPVVHTPRGVKVFFSPVGVIADDVIRDLVAAEPPGRVVVVVTGDQAVLADVTRAGARGASADALRALIS